MPGSVPPFGVIVAKGYTFDNMAKCASCGADIAWCITTKGHRAPMNPGGESHFATCPNAADHRRPKVAREDPT